MGLMKCYLCKEDKSYFTDLFLTKVHFHKDAPKQLVCGKCLGYEQTKEVKHGRIIRSH